MVLKKTWILIGIIFLLILLLMATFIISKQDVMFKAPLLNNVYFVKIIDAKSYSNTELLNMFISKIEDKGYEYIKEENLGGILMFSKNGVNKTFIHPKFILFKWFM